MSNQDSDKTKTTYSDLELVFRNELSYLNYEYSEEGDITVKEHRLKVVEDNYLEVSKDLLINELYVYEEGEIINHIKNIIKVKILDKEGNDEGKLEDNFNNYKVGDKLMSHTSDYMVKMFHPKYKSYLELVDYLKEYT